MEVAGYKIVAHIGSGGMGEVYKGYHPGLNRVAAIKVLYQKDGAERFKNEAYIQSSVTHPNITRLYEYVVAGQTPCIVMEYVEGETLDALIRKKGKLTNSETENILAQIASALSYLHQRDILHRDLKPQNFKMEKNGTVKMLDFGIAKNKYTPKLTQQGFVVGTTEYMAPEQFQHGVEKKSDIWSLGVMAYEMVTGYMPFEATNPITLRTKIARGSFTDPKILVPQISSKLETLIEKSLRINAASRLSAVEIEKLLTGEKEPSFVRKSKDLAGNNRKPFIYLGVFVMLIFAFVILGNFGAKDSQEGKLMPGIDTLSSPAMVKTVKINVPSVNNAFIVFPDNTRKPIPSEIKGKEGENIMFIIQAEGYIDKPVEIKINTRRRSYEYNLEKKN